MIFKRHSLILLLQIFVAASSYAAAPVVKIETQPVDGTALEVSATEATNPEELASVADWVEGDLRAAQEKNHDLKPQAVIAEQDRSGNPDVQEIPLETLKSGRDGLLKKFDTLLSRHGRVTFTIIRGLSSLGVATWGLIAQSHMSFESALSVGILAGGFAATMRWNSTIYRNWLNKSTTTPGRFWRSFKVNTFYSSLIKGASTLAGAPLEHSLKAIAKVVLENSGTGTLAVGTMNLGIAMQTRRDEERYPERVAQIRRFSDLKADLFGLVANGVSFAALCGFPVAKAGMYGFIGAGTVYYTSVLLSPKLACLKQYWDELRQGKGNGKGK